MDLSLTHKGWYAIKQRNQTETPENWTFKLSKTLLSHENVIQVLWPIQVLLQIVIQVSLRVVSSYYNEDYVSVSNRNYVVTILLVIYVIFLMIIK